MSSSGRCIGMLCRAPDKGKGKSPRLIQSRHIKIRAEQRFGYI